MSSDTRSIASTPSLLVEEKQTASGDVVAIATLNKPKALNALDLEMAQALLDNMHAWQSRDEVKCVVIMGSGDKAFCAGGDIVSMYKAMQDCNEGIPSFLKDFFTCEYKLDYTIHTFAKPVIVVGSGIVMGGGMGLMAGASHRLVTPTSRLAMPEITIGLYPDVGGSYFLPRLPGKTGLFLGLTGASINATDALYLGMADHAIANESIVPFIDSLVAHEWRDDVNADIQVDELINAYSSKVELPAAQVEPVRDAIDTACHGDGLAEIVDNIAAMDDADNKWLSRAKSTLKAGSPITAHLVYQQCLRGGELSLLGCFEMELVMSCRCGEHGEFQEGVRALLIDKDNAPQWAYKDVTSVPEDVIATFFTSPWDKHPLASLES